MRGTRQICIQAAGNEVPEAEKNWVGCTECWVLVAASFLRHHMKWFHGTSLPKTREVGVRRVGPTIYVVYLSRVLKTLDCPVPGCPAVAHRAGRVREHFIYQRFCSKVTMLQERKDPLTHRDMCGMYMLAGLLIKHGWKTNCFKNIDIRLRRRNVEIAS